MNNSPNKIPSIIPINAQPLPYIEQPNILMPQYIIKNPLPPPNIIQSNSVLTNSNNYLICNNLQNQGIIVNPNYCQNALLGLNNNNILVESQAFPEILYSQMTLTTPAPNIAENDLSENINEDKSFKKLIDSVYNAISKEDLKERNRIAAQKWRKKKNNYLAQLESTNYELRKEAISLDYKVKMLKKENIFLEEELHFFHSFMSKIMINPPKEKE